LWSSIKRRVKGAPIPNEQCAEPPLGVTSVAATTPGPLVITGVDTGATADVKALVGAVVASATALWRLQVRLEREKRETGAELPKWMSRQLESACDTMAEAGIEVRDHTGEPYVTGLALTVMAFQPQAGVTVEVVQETVKPSVFFKGALVQSGQVIVAIPAGATIQGQRPSEGLQAPDARGTEEKHN